MPGWQCGACKEFTLCFSQGLPESSGSGLGWKTPSNIKSWHLPVVSVNSMWRVTGWSNQYQPYTIDIARWIYEMTFSKGIIWVLTRIAAGSYEPRPFGLARRTWRYRGMKALSSLSISSAYILIRFALDYIHATNSSRPDFTSSTSCNCGSLRYYDYRLRTEIFPRAHPLGIFTPISCSAIISVRRQRPPWLRNQWSDRPMHFTWKILANTTEWNRADSGHRLALRYGFRAIALVIDGWLYVTFCQFL